MHLIDDQRSYSARFM